MLYGDVYGWAVSGLSTKHVVLGLLIERPGYGYDLQQRLDSRLGFLGLSESAVYKILDRLEEDGWIEVMGEKVVGRTRRGAPRVMYRVTAVGRERFKAWIAEPSDRAVLRDELQAKLIVVMPDYLPELLNVADRQKRECLAELDSLATPSLARAASPEVPWHYASELMVDDFNLRFVQTLVDWLEAICEVMEERIRRAMLPSSLAS
jgi:DNA-binding PadR family transcriptional regulator